MADLGLTLESVREAITENLALTNRLRELWHLAKEWLHFIITLCFVAYLVARREQRRYARRLRAAKSAMSFARQRDATTPPWRPGCWSGSITRFVTNGAR